MNWLKNNADANFFPFKLRRLRFLQLQNLVSSYINGSIGEDTQNEEEILDDIEGLVRKVDTVDIKKILGTTQSDL